jgi:phosphate-selective porin OprO/OprP
VKYLLSFGALVLLAAPSAFAADSSTALRRLEQMQKAIAAQQEEIRAQQSEIDRLNRALGRTPATRPAAMPAPIETRLRQQDRKIDALVAQFAAERDTMRPAMQERAHADIPNGRPAVTSADGRFSAALRMTVQYDMGYYMQPVHARHLPLGPDLSSGGNFRRAQLGLQGTLFDDWSYAVRYDFGSGGSNGAESPGHLQQAYLEYDGLAPLAFRIGAHAASTGMDDTHSSADQLLLERSAVADLGRGMASGARYSAELVYLGARLFASLALTGDKVQGTGAFDEQQALAARLAYSVVADSDWRWVVSSGGADVFKIADGANASPPARPFALKNLSELVIDDNTPAFVSFSEADAARAWDWNMESALARDNLMLQAGYYRFGIDPGGAGHARRFHGWYAEGSWVMSGERRGWSTANAAFTNPRPHADFGDGRGWGAWELAGRYSTLDLNDHEGVAGSPMPPGGARGGEQRIAALGLNWYPNTALKFMLQLQQVQISRIGTNSVTVPAIADADLGQSFDTIALRSQVAF